MKILITGIAGTIGQLAARTLAQNGHTVVGIDPRPWPNHPRKIRTHQIDIRKRAAEDVFRTLRPDAVIHLATVTHLHKRPGERFRINLLGTRAIFDHCDRYQVKQAVFVGRHTYYGAASDAPLYHVEADPPIGVGTFPELADLVAADLYAGSSLWRYPKLSTSVLRLCYTLGHSHSGTLAAYLRGPRVPTVLGYDPLFQFVHEQDASTAICLAITHSLRGVFNVAGPAPVPLSMLIHHTGRRALPMPQFALRRALGHLGLPKLPTGAIEHIKYPVVIDSSAFYDATGFEHQYDDEQCMRDFAADASQQSA